MSREQLLQELAEAFEKLIGAATEAGQRGVTHQGDTWGPRETLAHMAGWEVMATVRVPKIAAGMQPFEESDEARQEVMNAAINAAFVVMIGDQPLEAVCGIVRQAYQRDIEMLRTLEDKALQPGEYPYERTRGVIEHCQEHMEELRLLHP
jgi:hypothetical protein